SQAPIFVEAQQAGAGGLAHVGVDQQDAASELGEAPGQVQADGSLAVSRLGGGHQQSAHGVVPAEQYRTPQRAVGLREVLSRLPAGTGAGTPDHRTPPVAGSERASTRNYRQQTESRQALH